MGHEIRVETLPPLGDNEELKNNPAVIPHLPFPENSPLYLACQDKTHFQRWCESNSLPTPATHIADRIEDVPKLAEALGFPCIIKGARGSGGKAVFVIENKTALEQTLQQLHEQNEEAWAVQEFITGTVGSTTFISKHSLVYAHCSSEKFACIGGSLGPSALRRFGEQQTIGELAKQVVSAGQISGITGFDWMRTESGQYKIIDPHFGRCTSSLAAFYKQGLEVDQAFHASLTKGSASPACVNSGKIVWMMPQALELFFKGGVVHALRSANPLRRDVSIFWCGKGEWRMLLSQIWNYSLGHAIVVGGALRQKLRDR